MATVTPGFISASICGRLMVWRGIVSRGEEGRKNWGDHRLFFLPVHRQRLVRLSNPAHPTTLAGTDVSLGKLATNTELLLSLLHTSLTTSYLVSQFKFVNVLQSLVKLDYLRTHSKTINHQYVRANKASTPAPKLVTPLYVRVLRAVFDPFLVDCIGSYLCWQPCIHSPSRSKSWDDCGSALCFRRRPFFFFKIFKRRLQHIPPSNFLWSEKRPIWQLSRVQKCPKLVTDHKSPVNWAQHCLGQRTAGQQRLLPTWGIWQAELRIWQQSTESRNLTCRVQRVER